MSYEFLGRDPKRIAKIIDEGMTDEDINFVNALVPQIEIMHIYMQDCLKGSASETIISMGVLNNILIKKEYYEDLIINPAGFKPDKAHLEFVLGEKLKSMTESRWFLELKDKKQNAMLYFMIYLVALQLNYYQAFWGAKIALAKGSYWEGRCHKTEQELQLCNDKLLEMRLELRKVKKKKLKTKEKVLKNLIETEEGVLISENELTQPNTNANTAENEFSK